MTADEERGAIQVVCRECTFSKVVETGDERPAEVIVEHGRETGHKLTTEEIESPP